MGIGKYFYFAILYLKKYIIDAGLPNMNENYFVLSNKKEKKKNSSQHMQYGKTKRLDIWHAIERKKKEYHLAINPNRNSRKGNILRLFVQFPIMITR